MTAAGLNFDVEAVNVDERRLEGERPELYVDRLARLKASVAAERHPGVVVVGADTAVVIGDTVLGKPVDSNDAVQMLRQLSGRTHDVLTGLAVACAGTLTSDVVRTRVLMRSFSEREISDYVSTGEPSDKAGSYAVQGRGSRLISQIEGSFTNVVGLPVAALLHLLARAGIRIS